MAALLIFSDEMTYHLSGSHLSLCPCLEFSKWMPSHWVWRTSGKWLYFVPLYITKFVDTSFYRKINQLEHLSVHVNYVTCLKSRKMKHHFTFIWSHKNIWMTHYHNSEWDIVLKVLLGTNYNICHYMLIMWHMSQLYEVMLFNHPARWSTTSLSSGGVRISEWHGYSSKWCIVLKKSVVGCSWPPGNQM